MIVRITKSSSINESVGSIHYTAVYTLIRTTHYTIAYLLKLTKIFQ